MKKVFYFTIFYCLSTGICLAQLEEKITRYHLLINKAEVLLCENNYKEASKLYEAAFDLIDTPFAQDLYNASVCYAEIKNFSASIKLCKKLVLKGCDLRFFQKSTFTKLRNQKKLWKGFCSDYNSLRAQFEQNSDKKLISDLNKLLEADQNYYCEAPKRIEDNIFSDSLFSNDSYIAKKLIEYFEKYGYLSEEKVGVNINDTTLSVFPVFNVLIRHNYQKKHYDFTGYL